MFPKGHHHLRPETSGGVQRWRVTDDDDDHHHQASKFSKNSPFVLNLHKHHYISKVASWGLEPRSSAWILTSSIRCTTETHTVMWLEVIFDITIHTTLPKWCFHEDSTGWNWTRTSRADNQELCPLHHWDGRICEKINVCTSAQFTLHMSYVSKRAPSPSSRDQRWRPEMARYRRRRWRPPPSLQILQKFCDIPLCIEFA